MTRIAFVLLAVYCCACNPSDQGETPEKLDLVASLVDSSTVVSLVWNVSPNKSFDSYELYRHSSSGINESNGELIHISTDPSDIFFIDTEASGGSKHYYRVYHRLTNGNSSGSNIESIDIPGINLIKNGGFEETNEGGKGAENWDFVANEVGNPNNEIIVVNDLASSGQNSLRFYHDEEIGCWEQWASQTIINSELKAGKSYRLEFDYKATFEISDFTLFLRNNIVDINSYFDLDYKPDDHWSSFSGEIVMPENTGSTNFKLTLHFCEYGQHYIWMDNVVFKPI